MSILVTGGAGYIGSHTVVELLERNENWWGYKDGYKRGQTPKLGAVMCYRKGKAGVSSDGAGHVLIVEKIYSDGSVLASQSGYKSSRFWTSVIPKGYALKGYVFQGFIYNPFSDQPIPPIPPTPSTFIKTKFPWVLYARKLRNRRRK